MRDWVESVLCSLACNYYSVKMDIREMREHKCRIWDKEKNYFVDPTFYFIQPDGSIWFNLGASVGTTDDLLDQSEKLEATDCAGIKDKNGKEIYEGDVVQLLEYGDVVYAKYQVAWNPGDNHYPAFDLVGWEGDANAFSEIMCDGAFLIEIIGNIYESPELMEKTNG